MENILNTTRTKTKSLNAHNVRFAWGWLLGMMVYYTIFAILPIIMVLRYSFFKWDGIYTDDMLWVGFKNYLTFLTEPEYYMMFINTIIMGLTIMIISFIVSFFVALMLMRPIKGKTAFRAIWYIPVVVSMAVVSELVSNMLDANSGVINTMLTNFGLKPVMWQLSTPWMYFWIILVSIWKGLGGLIILLLAGMAGIPQELYEAADIDGATSFKKLLHITLPCLRQMFAFILVTSSMGIFSIFEQVQLISKGGPGTSTMVIMYQIYNEAFASSNVGMSSALSVIVLLLVFGVTLINMKVSKIRL